MSSLSPYTCITCHVAFHNGELQRAHYKTDWHRYNLKRKVADLGPITAVEFAEKVEAVQQQQRADQVNEENRRSTLSCKDCGKSFSSENGLLNHTKSKKHLETVSRNAARAEEVKKKFPVEEIEKLSIANQVDNEDEPTDEDDEENWNDMDEDDETVTDQSATNENESEIVGRSLSIEECLFCSMKSVTLEENLSHMAQEHSFFLPDFEYISNLSGLIEYLDEKVGVYHVCLWCNKHSFRDVLSVQRHMMAKGHTKILFDENPNSAWEYVDFYDYSSSHPDANEKNLDEEIDENFLDTTGYELTLPSGKKVGHRTLVRYYRQNLSNRNNERSIEIVHKLKDKYRALGWSGPGTTGEVFQRKVRDLKYLQQWKSKQFMRLGVKSNALQHHFREQVNF